MKAVVVDQAYNLTALAQRLLKEGRKLDLANKILGAVDARSIAVDLTIALEACDALAFSLDNAMQQPANFRETTEAALLSYLVILYARATKSSSDIRKQYDPRPKFNADEKQVHTELCDLRDQAIAHFGRGGSYTGDWTVELAILDIDHTVRAAVVTRRLVVDRALLYRAKAQIARALEIINPLCTSRINLFIDAINAECVADPAFHKEVSQHPLNIAIFLARIIHRTVCLGVASVA